MVISRREISSLVLDLFRDSVFGTSVEPYLDFGIDRLNRDRPHVKVTDYTVQSADVAQDQWGTVIALPSGFDFARDKVVSIEDLNTDGIRRVPAVHLYDWALYQEATDTVTVGFLSKLDVGRQLRISWRSAYTFADGSSNVPDSLARPLALVTAYFYMQPVIGKLAQAKREGGDEIAFTTQMSNVKQLAETYLAEYQALVKELEPAPAGVTPSNVPASAPSRMGRVTR